MKLMTKAIEKAMPAIYATDGVPVADKEVVAKFFTPWANLTWYVFEGDKRDDGDYEFFGVVEGLEIEMGYFTLNELMKPVGPGGLRVERDRHFEGAVPEKIAAKFAPAER